MELFCGEFFQDNFISMSKKKVITIEADVNAPVAKAWEFWTKPEHIVHWNNASDEWHTPTAENDFRPGGRFVCRMEAKDGSMGFDFGGTNNIIDDHKYIEYTLDDDQESKDQFFRKWRRDAHQRNF